MTGASYITFYLPRWWFALNALSIVLSCTAYITHYWALLIPAWAAFGVVTYIYLSYWLAARLLRRTIKSAR